MDFITDRFMIDSEVGVRLYKEVAAKLPIIDYHCHLDAKEIYENKKFDNITQLWLAGDHYKWRAMRANGIAERYITGDATPEEKFKAYAETVEAAFGNPLYHWTHLELNKYFSCN
ncbi:glucuronate isomerase, partial [Salmonella enterica]|nr:glucuronate isomerase [Salmonella enterica]